MNMMIFTPSHMMNKPVAHITWLCNANICGRAVNVQELRHAVKAVEFKQHVVAAIAVFKLWICNNRCFKGFGILIFKTYYTINIHKEIIDDWIVLQMLLQTFAVNARVAPRLESC